jgi:hypothetical protein
MAHNIHGIITSFKYEGELPNTILVGNYHFIPFQNKYGPNYSDQTLEPYKELTKEARKTLKELSFIGKCAYIETNYFGGPGTQMSEVWENGERILGPLVSFDGIANPKVPEGTALIENSVNEALKTIGIYKNEEMDEFDSARLGWYRSNSEIMEEYEQRIKSKRL